MLEKILPENLCAALCKLNLDKLYEVRLRAGKPAAVNYGGFFRYLSPSGTTETPASAFKISQRTVEGIVYKACDCSIYAASEQIKQGFVTVGGGIRIGVCGEAVCENGALRTLKNFNSLNIRIPHEVAGCSLNAFAHIVNGVINNTLVISPPGAGKTTFLRDLARQFSNLSPIVSVTVIDERGELGACVSGEARLDIGEHTDILTNCTKKFGFEQGIRCMRPDVIITDEIGGADDVDAVISAIGGGVKVMASVHAYDHIDLSLKNGFDILIRKRAFNRYVVLSSRRGPGTLEGVYDENFNCLYLP